MKITKKIMSVVLAAVMVIGTFAVSVSAASIYDTAVNLPSGKKQTFTLSSDLQDKDYKVVLSKNGTLKININSNLSKAYLKVFDSDGNRVDCTEYDFTVGSGKANDGDINILCQWNKTTENFKCTAKYKLKKGTYYIRFTRSYSNGNGKTTLTATYPSKDSADGSSGKISYLTLEMEAGDTLRLGAVAEPADAEIKWTSSKTNVATVSASGKVTAKKEGSTIITAKSGSSSVKIKINVV